MKVRGFRYGMLVVVCAVLLSLSGCFLFPGLPGNGGEKPEPGNGGDNGENGIPESPDAVDFTLRSTDGNMVSLSDYRGRPVAIVFFHNNCGFCHRHAPDLEDLYQKYQDSPGLMILLIGTITTANPTITMPMVNQFKTAHGLTFPALLDRDGAVQDQFFSGRGVPRVLLVSPNGEVYQRGSMNPAWIEQSLPFI